MSGGWTPDKHPRDEHGRFTHSRVEPLSDADRAAARGIIADFKPHRFASAQDMTAYANAAPALPSEQSAAVDSYTGDTFLDINAKLRAGDNLAGDSTVTNLRAAMRPTQDDLILTRTVPTDVFKGFDLENLAGMKVRDAGFSSTSLGPAYGGGLGQVVMKIAVPKGTPAVFASAHSRNPHEQEVILPDGLEMAVASVKRNDQFGWDVSLIVLPKGQAAGQPKAAA
jgi:hypothetical protein